MIADVRRRAQQMQSLHVNPTPIPIQQSDSTFQFRANIPARASDAPTDVQSAELTAIKRDLGKTLLLSACAIGAELGLYWFSYR